MQYKIQRPGINFANKYIIYKNRFGSHLNCALKCNRI